MNKFYSLDEFVVDWWLKNNEISLIDICNHLSGESLLKGTFAENFEVIMKRKMSFGEEYQKD